MQQKRVVFIRHDGQYNTSLLRGISHYNHVAGWMQSCRGALAKIEPKPRFDGVIATIESLAQLRKLQRLSPCVVNCGHVRLLPCPRVGPDETKIGQVAADHFLMRGFKHFAFCGYPQVQFSLERERSFLKAVSKTCRQIHVFHTRAPFDFDGDFDHRMESWLRKLSTPCGVLAAHDLIASRIIQLCQHLRLRMPEEIALLGVDNDDALCHMGVPPLSSIDTHIENIGYAAAQMLDQLMAGHAPSATPVLISCGSVIVRHSTSILAISDQDVAAAVRFIGEHLDKPIRIDDILEHVPVSRRMLELRFRKVLGRTPHEELQRVRLERARDLLERTNLSIPIIVRKCGFTNVPHFTTMFKRYCGNTPAQFRRELRLL